MLNPPARPSIGGRIRQEWFASPASSLVSISLLMALAYLVWHTLSWGVLHSMGGQDPLACRAGAGACWAVVLEKHRLVLFGRYPAGEQWRPLVATLLLLSGVLLAALPRFFGRVGIALLAAALVAFVLLMAGGFADLTPVPTDLWGGLPLTVFLTVFACLLGAPLAMVLALSRRSQLPVLRWLATGYIELVRGVPLVTLLFFGVFVLPIVLPPSWRFDAMIRIAICLCMFVAAYLAEVFRGGLQSVAKGQTEAAHALSLSKWQTLSRVVLPQALRVGIAPTVNVFIGALKDTSLVMIVNLYDITGALKLALSDAQWRPYFVEMYLFVGAIYLTMGLGLAIYGRFLERRYALK
ncbi:amino acid ABC transporter permease [Curvibacter sp. CHRR-16]|uniref:amino acid ABC transporter permease n=1 Tax=Curvibacter sp. CHRR-16 TaxID=2835872 RepID=UPI002023B801|nr:amino acid ABC transporter permease [Curvibacter sp. CHRR-16]